MAAAGGTGEAFREDQLPPKRGHRAGRGTFFVIAM